MLSLYQMIILCFYPTILNGEFQQEAIFMFKIKNIDEIKIESYSIDYCRAPRPVPSCLVPYPSVTHPLPVPYLSVTRPLPIPYLSLTHPLPV